MPLSVNEIGRVVITAVAVSTSTSFAMAQDACKEVRVMVTAGPEEDVLIKYAKSDFEKQSRDHSGYRDCVARSLARPGCT